MSDSTMTMLTPKTLRLVENSLLPLVGLLMLASLYSVFLIVPDEAVMGPVQRIFYFHVGAAIACYVSFFIVFLAGLAFLAMRKKLFDLVLEASGEVGFVFCTIVLISGMIWGRAAWNTWFRWEPRLVTFLLLWLIFLAFNLLRAFGEPTRIAVHSSILGILGGLTVPLVWLSIRLLPSFAQLHPRVVETGGLKDPSYVITALMVVATMVLFQFLLIAFRTRIALLEHNAEEP